MNPDPWLTVRDASHISRVPLSTLQRWVTRGLVTSVGGKVSLARVQDVAAELGHAASTTGGGYG